MIYFILIGLFLVCFASIGARSLKSFSRHQLEEICRHRGTEAKLQQILKEYERVGTAAGVLRSICVTVLLIGLVLGLFHSQSLTTDIFETDILAGNWWSNAKNEIALILLSILLLLLVEFWLPRPIAKLWGTSIAYYTWGFWRRLAFVFHPFWLIDRFVAVCFYRLAGESEETDEEEAFEDEIRTMVTEGHREGLLEEDAREMIEGVMELSDFAVSEIMTPRTDMISIPDTLTWDEMLCEVISTPHSRIPVYHDNRDDIIGVIHSKDLLRVLAQNTEESRPPWTNLMKEPLFVPETKPVDTLLQEFQNTKISFAGALGSSSGDTDEDSSQRAKGHLAIVLDEYGGVSGIVTLEDILEEIVGEILDEHDPVMEIEDILEIETDRFESLGKVRIDDINEALGLDLPEEEDYDTIAGFIFSTLGHVPDVGETVEFEHEGKHTRFTVIEATRRRIEKIRIDRNPGT